MNKTMRFATIRFAAPLIAAAMMSAPAVMPAQTMQNNQSQNQTTDWMAPPAGTEQAQAYKDGIEAAQLDSAAKRPTIAEKSFLYNHPPVKKAAEKDAYRATFAQGYKAALAHNGGTSSGGR